MILPKITEEELSFYSLWVTPKSFVEILFSDFKHLNVFDEDKFGHIRLYQEPFLSDESLIDFEATAKYHNLTDKEKFQLKKNVGDVYCFCARKIGKTAILEKLDLLVSMLHFNRGDCLFASVDMIHLREVLDKVKVAMENHPICKLWNHRITGAPDYKYELINDFVLNSVNFALGSKNPGQQFVGKHTELLYIEEACIAGRTRIAFCDKERKRHTKRISDLVNNNLWQDIKVFSYNTNTHKIELKSVKKSFKKTIKNYTYYKVEIFSLDKNKKRVLDVSQKQEFWIGKKYKLASELSSKDYLYTLDYQKLSKIQKEILVGTLLGDASLNVRKGGWNPIVKDNLETYKVLNVTPVNTQQWTMYDLEIEDNHNFFANGVLIHNSLETAEVNEKRHDATEEDGTVFRISGMTNFTKHSPAGKLFFDIDNKDKIINLPQFVSPKWDEKEKKDRIKQYGDKESAAYKIFVLGEVIEDGVSVFDVKRIDKHCYNRKTEIKSFEIGKDTFERFKEMIIVERPKNAKRIFINADIGESAGTHIVIHSEINEDKYNYLYRISLYNLIHDEQLEIFEFLIDTLHAEVIGIDNGDAFGRILCDHLEQKYSTNNVVRYQGAGKIDVATENDENGRVLLKKGNPVYRQEKMSVWSVNRLKHLLYEGKVNIPIDFLLDTQLNSVIATHSGNQIIYSCVAESDHLFDAWRVFAISVWSKSDSNLTKFKQDENQCLGITNW